MNLGFRHRILMLVGPAVALPLVLALPSAAAGDPSGLESDDFGGTTLDARWTFVDPVGDANVVVEGGRAVIRVPAESNHDLWTGANRAPRIVQSAADSDFTVEVKFDSAVEQRFQMQGLVVEQGPNDLLRFEVHSDGSATHLFVAALAAGNATALHDGTVAGGAPAYLRLERVEDTWTLRHSTSGIAWTTEVSFAYPLSVSRVGVFAGNAGFPPPAHAVEIDYFLVVSDLTGDISAGQGARAGYCSAPGNTVNGVPIPSGTFLNLVLGQPRTDPNYAGAIPANFFEGIGISCDRPPAGYVAAARLVDGLGRDGEGDGKIYRHFARR